MPAHKSARKFPMVLRSDSFGIHRGNVCRRFGRKRSPLINDSIWTLLSFLESLPPSPGSTNMSTRPRRALKLITSTAPKRSHARAWNMINSETCTELDRRCWKVASSPASSWVLNLNLLLLCAASPHENVFGVLHKFASWNGKPKWKRKFRICNFFPVATWKWKFRFAAKRALRRIQVQLPSSFMLAFHANWMSLLATGIEPEFRRLQAGEKFSNNFYGGLVSHLHTATLFASNDNKN